MAVTHDSHINDCCHASRAARLLPPSESDDNTNNTSTDDDYYYDDDGPWDSTRLCDDDTASDYGLGHDDDEETLAAAATPFGCRGPWSFAELRRPFEVGDDYMAKYPSSKQAFWAWPFFGPLVFQNETSDARDHCANERTFLSYVRLSVYMAIVAVAIVLSFHLKDQPSALELRMARPLGLIFWILSLACLLLGLGNYVQTVNEYSRKTAIVQTGWVTQSIISLISLTIVGTSLVLLVVAKLTESQ